VSPSRPDISATRTRERNRHHSWLVRLPVFVWLAYLFVRYLGDPTASSLWGGINLAFHEAGHILFSFFPEFWTVAGGTLTEMAIPLVAAALFIRQKEDFGAAVALFWLATVLMGTAVYAGDARARVLPLVSPFAGDPMHDWYYLLGRLGLLQRDQFIAALFRTGGLLTMATALFLGGRIVWLMATDPERKARRAGGQGPLPRESALEGEGRRFQAWLAARSAGEGRGEAPGTRRDVASGPDRGSGIRGAASHAAPGEPIPPPEGPSPTEPPRKTEADQALDEVREAVDPSALTPEERRLLEFLDRKGKRD
jgi:hypothetical protein